MTASHAFIAALAIWFLNWNVELTKEQWRKFTSGEDSNDGNC